MNLNGTAITVCPVFWEYIGRFPLRACSDIPDDIVSWQMTFPGDTIFHLLLSYVGIGAIDGLSITDWQMAGAKATDPVPDYSGAAQAMMIRVQASDKAVMSVTNYDWYALVSPFFFGSFGSSSKNKLFWWLIDE